MHGVAGLKNTPTFAVTQAIVLAQLPYIRKSLAVFFLALFAFGITPRLTLHNLVANHKDGRTRSVLPDPYSTQLSKASFNCQCDNLISESPFVMQASVHVAIAVTCFKSFTARYAEFVFTAAQYCSCLRGPPAC